MRGLRSLTIILLIAGVPSAAAASGFEVAEQGAAAGGTASAGTARAGVPEAAHFNPSLLAGDPGWSVGLHLAAVFASIEASALDGAWTSELEGPPATPAALHAAYGFGPWAVGLAVGIAHGSSLRWPAAWPERFEIQESGLRVVRTAPLVAYQRGSWSFALGPQLDWGYLRTRRALDFIAEEGSAELLMTGWGFGAHASLSWRPHDDWTLGVSYRSRARLGLSGDADFETPLTFAFRAPDQHVETQFWLPDRFAFGLAYTRGPWRVLLDLGVTTWSVQDRQELVFSHEGTPNLVRETKWTTAAWVRGGAEWSFSDALVLRAGLGVDPTPVSERFLSPISPDSTRVISSLGVGWRHASGFTADLYYQLVVLTGSEASSDEVVQARYSGTINTLGLGLAYAPP